MSNMSCVKLNIPVVSFNEVLDNLLRKHKNFNVSVLIDSFPDLMLHRIEKCTLGSNEDNEAEYEKEVWLLEEHLRLDYEITGEVIFVMT